MVFTIVDGVSIEESWVKLNINKTESFIMRSKNKVHNVEATAATPKVLVLDFIDATLSIKCCC